VIGALLDATIASAFVARWAQPRGVEIADSVLSGPQ
jgi:hypothetical protein